MDLIGIIDKLKATRDLTDSEWKALLDTEDEEVLSYLSSCARQVRESIYGKAVYIRGLIEFTNYCKNGCYYCGINCSNTHADRYRLTDEQILACVSEGYELGFRTFVLQGGEDPFYTDDKIVSLVRAIKEMHPDCAVTLRSERRVKRAIVHTSKQEQTDIFSVTRRHLPNTIGSSIRKICHGNIG